MLTAEQLRQREGKLTASRVACLVNGDDEAVYNLWLELTGDPDFSVPDFTWAWPVKLGEVTEELNLRWFEHKYGPITGKGRVFVHPEHEWAAATLDGWSETHACPVECKHVGGFERLGEIIDRYQPQMQWTMWVSDAEQCALSVIQGGKEPVVEFIPADAAYISELARLATNFMDCVRTLRPPVSLPVLPAPQNPIVAYDVESNWRDSPLLKEWTKAAGDWRGYRDEARKFDAAAKALKKLVPGDARTITGAGIIIKRARNGSLTIKESVDDGNEDEG